MSVNRGRRISTEKHYAERLKSEILNSFTVDHTTECHEWSKSLHKNGYGQKRAFGKMMLAHRISWLVFNGEIKDGLEVAHCCGNRKCVNPSHLKLITHAENMRERALFGEIGRRKITLNGVEYRSVADAAIALGKSRATLRYHERKNKGVTNGITK